MITLESNIKYIKGVGEKRAALLNRLGVYSVLDLLYLLPRKYIDFSNPAKVSFAPYDRSCAVKATVVKNSGGVRIKGGKTLFKIICADDTVRLTLTYFNAEYTVKKLEVGKEYIFYGKLSGSMLNREMTSPVFIPADGKTVKQQPVYPLTLGISSAMIHKYILTAFENLGEIEDFIPKNIAEEYNLMPLDTALRGIHGSDDTNFLERCKNRLIFDEFFILQLGLSTIGEKDSNHTEIVAKNCDISKFLSVLPFEPTEAQLCAINTITEDFKSSKSMNRLLQGDVGCGKTLVGEGAMFCMAQNGYQSCMMAPTEILAVQHFNSVNKLFEIFGFKTALLTASAKAKERREILQGLKDGSIDILIGTHSVLNDNVVFKNLGLCITDEQHRFGVAQRTKVAAKGQNPHILVMSATPIPRTLAMIIYGNMQITVIDQMPKGRKPVETYLVGTDKRARMFGFIDKHIQQGKQCYIVLPAIEDSENMTELASVTGYYNDVIKQLLPNARCGILHGKLKATEKDQIMASFKNRELDLLCSTTVIEVGVDVPNAVLMVIENAERYGLSALHQLRGRVGRGSDQSYCILVSDNNSKNVQQRLRFLCANQDGFKVSQYDLDNRGPGDFFGNRQHGLPNLKIADLSTDITVLQQSQKACRLLLANPSWQTDYPKLFERLNKLFQGFVL